MKSLLNHLTRWPLLFGAILCLTLGLLVADATGAYELVVGVLVTLGTFLLGAWMWAMATHTSPEPRDPPGDEDAP